MPYRKRMPRRRRLARKGLKKRGMRRMKRNTNFIGGPNTCKVTEVFNQGLLNANTAETYEIPGIVPGSRAAAVAPNFGLYRIAYVQWTLRPLFDTFVPSVYQPGGGPVGNQPVSVPYFYWKMNRYGDAPAAFTAEYLREQGSKPIRLDDKTIRWGYKPNTLVSDVGPAAAALQGGSGQVKMTPWISTDNRVQDQAFGLSTTNHYGHSHYVEVPAAGNAQPNIGQLEVKVIYEFKNPRGITQSGQAATQKQVTKVESDTSHSQ